MVIMGNECTNKVKTNNELIENLNRYRGILSKTIIEYLESLIGLEISIIKESISVTDREVLSELEIYNQIAIYNIYNKALKLFDKINTDIDMCIYGNNEGKEGLSLYARLNDERGFNLFDFNYRNQKDTNLEINLYQTLDNKELRETELDKVMETLEKLYNVNNPYATHKKINGDQSTSWDLRHQCDVKYYEDKFKELDSRINPSQDDIKEIELRQYVHNIFFEDYGLTSDSFEEYTKEDSSFDFPMRKHYPDLMKKTLTKKIPKIDIKNNIKYL